MAIVELTFEGSRVPNWTVSAAMKLTPIRRLSFRNWRKVELENLLSHHKFMDPPPAINRNARWNDDSR
ncbi:hypothetical protein M427DRAFT_56451 [Gonapodya prolifera JEL478]|uniref:Uncharacterized protein n=1 Tax=Gonapodya prolifera (strain JEL478) TaxID=1344416 RepID=A0A139AH43_GONPJ|nr:hypothetical protein M427DRAFT_56451 [Gonapodya prolifera JEL478]|eukprot:KXS15884.1 hypothetical protein M427DRAFT_56451 [Gonapodya prolifera JEL478]